MNIDVIYGFLGSGKTTFITRILREWGAAEKIVVLVNEFGEVGIDGFLLKESGGEVVELTSGCICCTLQSDFRTQIMEIHRAFQPERVIVEPTGVATIAQIRSIFEAQLFEDVIDEIHMVMIADATGFMEFYRVNRHFVEAQVKNADLALLNKCDQVKKKQAILLQNAMASIQPDLTVLLAEFGAVDWAEYKLALSGRGGGKRDWLPEGKGLPTGLVDLIPTHEAGTHPHRVEEGEDALGYESFGRLYGDRIFSQGPLEDFFERLRSLDGGMGEVVRAKGIFRINRGWILMELASGNFSSQPIGEFTENRISIIGKKLNRERLEIELNGCIVPLTS